VIAALASEQQAGTLSIAPTRVMTSSEPRSADMTAKIRAAWGVEPHDIYATTENGPIASDCRAHRGLHVMEDRAIVEVVDADDKPVPDGEPGHHMLVTNLFNRTQPFIRHRLSDMAAYELGSCSCGLPFRRLRSVDGRVDDIIELTTADGRTASIHPTAFSPLFALDGVGELDVVQRGDHLVVHVVASSTARNGDGTDTVRRRLGEILAEHQCERASVTVTPVERLERNQRSGKIKLVRREK
jgi:phenylacetate-coenzyme A ligase PaaK-like adenylate-forming protein